MFLINIVGLVQFTILLKPLCHPFARLEDLGSPQMVASHWIHRGSDDVFEVIKKLIYRKIVRHANAVTTSATEMNASR